MSRIPVMVAAVLAAAAAFPRPLAAWEGQALLDVLPTAALAPNGASSSLMQTETTEVTLQGALSHTQPIAEGLSLAGTMWGMADTLPSQTPLYTPPSKIDLESRILELKLVWEAVPGTLIVTTGKEVIHPSSGFFRTPLNVISHGALGNAANISGSAVGTWEEGWIGEDVTVLFGSFSLSNFFSPRLPWGSGTDTMLRWISFPQNDWQNLTRLDVRLGEADIRVLGLLSTGGPGTADPDLHATFGAGVDTNIGEALTVRAEASIADSVSRVVVTDDKLLLSASQTVSWAPRALAGFTWTNKDQLSIMAEYYYNGSGFAGDDYQNLIRYTQNRHGTGADLMDQFGTFSAGQHYGFARISGNIGDKLSAAAWTQMNLQDLSGLSAIVLTLTYDRWTVNASLMDAWGSTDTEAGLSPLLWRADLEVSLYL